ncbi:winged helix family two component transcriptional regulator [Oceanococcus atlanticus]|uniref:Winged helix family two component transcriptional regulator n=2 Tax=Oceanococcus atlanticus TaxID=1317117 RepID=A0A1Y1SIB5_9GAMM|nr:winged helix family two component transcriptional regulator [Oceanococcus atlanticus]
MGMRQILLIDGDTESREKTRQHLLSRGAAVSAQPGAEDLDTLLAGQRFDLVVCALDLPQDNGFSVTARVRMNSHAGVILIAADSNRDDRLLALTVGADHVISRPVDLRELDMLIDNLQRRLQMLGDASSDRASDQGPQRPAHWVFDPAQWTLCPPAGESIQLSLAEYIVLGRLLDQPGEPVRRDELLRVLDRQDVRVFSRNLDMVISRLRRKAARAGAVSLPVMAARGIGYVFTGRVVVV